MPPFQVHEFRREEHVYINDAFSELLKDAVRFFHGTPVLSLPLAESFKGAGVYAIYCISKNCLHPGRPWAMRMSGEEFPVAELKRRVVDYFAGVRCRH